jgi:hypothetical protein
MIHDPHGSDEWQTVTLHGGPFSEQTMLIPRDQQKVALHDGPTQHNYWRLTDAPELYHENVLVGAFGRGGRR